MSKSWEDIRKTKTHPQLSEKPDVFDNKISNIPHEKIVLPWMKTYLQQEVQCKKTHKNFKVFAPIRNSNKFQCMVCKPRKVILDETNQNGWRDHLQGKVHQKQLKIRFPENFKQVDPVDWIKSYLEQEVECLKTNKKFKIFALTVNSNDYHCVICRSVREVKLSVKSSYSWRSHVKSWRHQKQLKIFRKMEHSETITKTSNSSDIKKIQVNELVSMFARIHKSKPDWMFSLTADQFVPYLMRLL